MRYLWKIGGEAGFGIMTTGLLLSKLASRSGDYVFDYPEYPSLIRGGHNTYEVLIGDTQPASISEPIDLLVCLNEETFDLHKKRLSSKAIVLYDHTEFKIKRDDYTLVNIPWQEMISRHGGRAVVKNIIALGVSAALLGGDQRILEGLIVDQFKKKGQDLVNLNLKFIRLGYSYIQKNYPSLIKKVLGKKADQKKKIVVNGNEAFSLGSVIADCRLYVAYPMTPASSVLTILAGWQEKTGMVVRHAEDEIAVVNTALGGSFAGVRASVGTSGGGFALMTETISLAGVTETPLVIFLAQRPGPATGLPTWTGQGDLLFAVNAGHGEFPKIVLAPGDVEEMVDLTMKAYNLADVYQTTVIVLSDKYLSESHRTITVDFLSSLIDQYKVKRGKLVSKPSKKPYWRYRVTEDGISERLVPGTKGYFYQANSYEHGQDSHTTEDPRETIDQIEKRDRKMKSFLKKDFQPAVVYGNLDDAETVFVTWGSTKGPVLEAIKRLGDKAALIHFSYLYPLDKKKTVSLFKKKKRYVLVENNYSAQFGKLLFRETGVAIEEKLVKYDGRPFFVDEIVSYLKQK